MNKGNSLHTSHKYAVHTKQWKKYEFIRLLEYPKWNTCGFTTRDNCSRVSPSDLIDLPEKSRRRSTLIESNNSRELTQTCVGEAFSVRNHKTIRMKTAMEKNRKANSFFYDPECWFAGKIHVIVGYVHAGIVALLRTILI